MFNKRVVEQEPAAPWAEEQRRVARLPCGRKANLGLAVLVGPSEWPSTLEDISTGGVGLVLGIRHEPGKELTLTLVGTHLSEPYALRARVAHLERLPDGYWHMGCAFLKPLSAGELEKLL